MNTRAWLRRRLLRLVRRPERAWGLGLILVLLVFVVIPLGYMAVHSFMFDSLGPRYVRGAVPGELTTFYWQRVLTGGLARSIFWQPFLNSLLIAILMTAIALPTGALFAWLVARTDVPFKGFFSAALIVPYIVPSWTVGLAWLTVFKSPRFGGQPGLLYAVLGIDPPAWLGYGLLPIVISLGIHYVPYTFILLRGALTTIDAQLEESAEILGSKRWEILRKITFPLVLPALGSAFVLTFGKGLGEFGTQAFLGLPIRYYTLSTRVYAAFQNRQQAEGYVLTLILILVTTLTVFANQKLIGARKRYTTISGKGAYHRVTKLGRWRRPATALLGAFILLFVAGPLGLITLETVMRYEGQYALSNLTLHYWIGAGDPMLAEGQPGIFRSSFILGAIGNSLQLAVITALVCGVLGIMLGYVVVRMRGTVLSRSIEFLSFTPYMIPGIAFGGIYLSLFARSWGPLPALYGTLTLLVLTCTMKYLPFASSSGVAAMHQIDPSLEEAAELHGARWGRRFVRILAPLAKSGFLSAVLLTLITTMRTLDLIVLLVTPQTRTMTSILFRFQQQSFTQHAYGIMLLIVIITLIGHFAVRRLGGKIEF
ncbi:iron ABC transporter permease [Candidatus Bipolaricaulota bacterium]|nr:iron ABC transporter permease [Candidatus Bipolaricaulota bacterium]